MVARLDILKGSTGINNVDDESRLGFDSQSYLQQLSVGTNIDIDKTHRINRRKGYRRVSVLSFNSFYNVDDRFLVCKYGIAGGLGWWCITFDGDTWTPVARLEPETNVLRNRYFRYGNDLRFMNGLVKGSIDLTLFEAQDPTAISNWTNNAYVGPDTKMELYEPPIGHLMFQFNGRLYVAQDNVLWFSRPFAYDWFRMATDFIPFDSRIRMAIPVEDGFFVSTNTTTYFFRGSNPDDFVMKEVASYPAVEWTEKFVSGDNFNENIVGPGVDSKVAIWASTKGICVGLPNGSFRNITKRKLVYNSKDVGSSVVIDDRFICVT